MPNSLQLAHLRLALNMNPLSRAGTSCMKLPSLKQTMPQPTREMLRHANILYSGAEHTASPGQRAWERPRGESPAALMTKVPRRATNRQPNPIAPELNSEMFLLLQKFLSAMKT